MSDLKRMASDVVTSCADYAASGYDPTRRPRDNGFSRALWRHIVDESASPAPHAIDDAHPKCATRQRAKRWDEPTPPGSGCQTETPHPQRHTRALVPYDVCGGTPQETTLPCVSPMRGGVYRAPDSYTPEADATRRVVLSQELRSISVRDASTWRAYHQASCLSHTPKST